ncbi:probable disease resistance protein At4g27220 isoform X1 [Glycine soja]|uniref:probable disease resistance protein At4g27220 isoform X1 n=2 Tax=Glycine soja TaxID=3848 RepID=UPI0010401F09|nr:probable disease resistance protein At4g27220 isoform X1 [Glycine soja]
MGDIVVSIVAKLAEYTVDPILHHARYLCCFNNIAGNLPNAKEELELTRNSVKERVEEAIMRTEKIEPAVEKWLKDVEKVLEEVHMLQGRISEVSKSYFRRQFQYFLTKKIARKIEKMAQLNHNSKFEPFSKIPELPGMKYYSSKDFVLFKSRESAFKKLLEALKDKSVSMIGLVGLGGSGKTTLAKEVGKKAEELKLFEKVVMTTVSQTPNIRSIQVQIADKLGLKFVEESEEARAQRLSERLRTGTTLLILDDLWEKLEFEAIGIPSNENNKGCGVILTTRSREVCISLQCQTIIELNLLAGDEAWDLFKLNANITDDSPYASKGVATKIVDECRGLPIAIVTVGSTLKGKTVKEWELALSRLKDSEPLDIPKGLRSPYGCLGLSYDNLTNELAKSLFLLCSIFPEDHEIDLEDLFRFGKGMGLPGTFGTMEKARREMQIAVSILIDCYLLLEASKKERVKMHDMVRDVALWIASKTGQAILASTGMDPRMLIEDESIKDKRAISLWDLKNGQLLDNDQLNCPSLEILLFHSPKVAFVVSNACFERLKMIKILAFLTSSYTWSLYTTSCTLSLPQSMKSLQNLHTLCLRGYKLGDISILESLQALEVLDLRCSSFIELPNGIASLKKLKLLDLFCCSIQENNAYEVIGRCLQLNELYLYILSYANEEFPHNISFPRLERYVLIYKMGPFYMDPFYLAMEIMDPFYLGMEIMDPFYLGMEIMDPFYLGMEIMEEHRPCRALCTRAFNASVQSFISLPIKDFFQKAEYLQLENLKGGYENVIPSMVPQGMNHLTFLFLEDCPEIKCVFDSTNVDLLQTEDAFSSLVILCLSELDNLEEVFNDPSSRCSLKSLEELTIKRCRQLYNISFPKNSKLCHLKFLTIDNCPMLTCIFKPSIVQTLELLEQVTIIDCYELKQIIEEVEEGSVDYVSSQSHTSLMLPKLRTLTILRCHSLEYIFPMCYVHGLASLEELEIEECNELKYVFGSEKEHDLRVYQHQSHPQTNIHINLGALWLFRLPNLVEIWPKYFDPHLPNLKELRCIDCPRLPDSWVRRVMIIDSDLQQDSTATEKELLCLVTTTFNQLSDQVLSSKLGHVLKFRKLGLTGLGVKGLFQFQIREHGSNTELAPLNLDLTHADLWDLPELEFIWKGPSNFLSLQMLDRIHVDGCPKLKAIFSPTIVRSLPMLTSLYITDCEELEQIFDSGDAQTLYTCSQQVCFPNLEDIWVKKCNKLKYLFHNFVAGHFHNLIALDIEDCSQLQKVFAFECETDDDDQEGIVMDGEKVLLRKLLRIRLSSLPNFKEIHHGFKLKDDVEEHIINDCPKYSPSLYLHTEE